MGELSRLLGSFNLQIFELLFSESASVRDLAKKANCSPAKITQFTTLYSKSNLVVLRNDKNRKFIAINKSNPLTRELITLVYINKILDSKAFSLLKKISRSIGVYGSVADGTVDRQSDIDLWAIASKRMGLIEVGKMKQQMTKELGREVSLRFFTMEEVKKLKLNDKIFYNELEYKSKILHGSGFGEEQG
jgi:predicted nucleotidyltransferase